MCKLLSCSKRNNFMPSQQVEGMKNEKILATAIYYYEQENITESHLAFRTAVDVSAGGHEALVSAQMLHGEVGWAHCTTRPVRFPSCMCHAGARLRAE